MGLVDLSKWLAREVLMLYIYIYIQTLRMVFVYSLNTFYQGPGFLLTIHVLPIYMMHGHCVSINERK